MVGDDGGMWVGIMLCWLGELVYGLCRRYFRHVTKIAPVPMYPHLRVNSGVGYWGGGMAKRLKGKQKPCPLC